MKLPLQVTFRNMNPSEAMEAAIREKVEKLEHYCDQIMRCRVVVEAQHKHQHQGNLFHVRIDLTLPGAELVANREPQAHQSHEDAYVAIRDAFDAMRRQLEDYVRKHRRDIKTHEVPPHGKISELHPAENYGRIMTTGGASIYFHRNSIINADFDDLEVGNEVRFSEESGEAGPQASTVHLIGKHHLVD